MNNPVADFVSVVNACETSMFIILVYCAWRYVLTWKGAWSTWGKFTGPVSPHLFQVSAIFAACLVSASPRFACVSSASLIVAMWGAGVMVHWMQAWRRPVLHELAALLFTSLLVMFTRSYASNTLSLR